MMLLSVQLAAIQGGDYVSALKVLPVVLVLFVWGRLLTWMDKDAPAANLPRVELNTGFVGGLVVAFIVFLLLPNFWIAISAFVFIFLIEIGVYLALRNQKVGLADLKGEMASLFTLSGGSKKVVEAPPGELLLVSKSGAPMPVPTAEDPNRPAYDAIQRLLTGPMKRGLERLDLIPSDGTSAVRYAIDGVVYSGGSVSRDEAAAAITYLKYAANLDVSERRKPQKGSFRVMLDGKKWDLQVETKGSTAGESLGLLTNPKQRHTLKLDALGFSEDQLTIVRQSVADKTGVVLVAAPKGQGLTSLIYGLVRAHDAFIQHILTLEREPEDDLEGITQNSIPHGAPGNEEDQMARWVTSQEPDVVMVPQVEDPRTAMTLVKFAETGRRVYIGLRAGSAFEALNQWRKLVGDDKAAVKSLNMVVAGRVVRRLCTACKVGYRPDAQTLRKLNMDPDRVGQLFQARTEPLRDNKGNPLVCQFCADLHFKGRIGIYEILQVTDEVKQAVMAGGDPGLLKAAFRKQKGRALQETALGQVEAGVTSVQEVLRVLRGGETAPQSPVRDTATPPAA